MKEFERARLKSPWILLFIFSLFVSAAIAQTNVSSVQPQRPFQKKVESLSQKSVIEQCKLIVELNRSLMAEDYANFTGQSDVSNFGHLARELAAQQKYDVMRALLKGRELFPYNYWTIANLLAEKFDDGAFELLITNSSVSMPPPESDPGTKEGKNVISGEGIPEYSALSLHYYLQSETFRERAEAHLIQILRDHKRTGVRAFAALALGYSKSPAVIQPLKAAAADKAKVFCTQCGEDYVGQYAQKALEMIEKNR